MEYRYQISECDVRLSEHPRLMRFRERLCQWHIWLFEDDHSIWQQIHGMLWNDMVWRTINEARRLAIENPSPAVGFNSAVALFIDQSYAADQLLSIRKLTEQNNRGDSITLFRLLEDMKKNSDLFTRELYVCHDGLPFDPKPVRERSLQKRAEEARKNGGVHVRWIPTFGPEAYDTSTRCHGNFDQLMAAVDRPVSRDDALEPKLFDDVKSKLGFCGGINKVASKLIAHAADASSRGQVDERDITLNKITACHRIICRVATYISGPLLNIGGGDLVPTPQFNQLQNFEKSWLDPNNLDTLHEFWRKRADRAESWVQGDWIKQLKLPS